MRLSNADLCLGFKKGQSTAYLLQMDLRSVWIMC